VSESVSRPLEARTTTRRAARVQSQNRLMSLDALRGFDMFWIAGGSLVVGALDKTKPNPLSTLLKTQLSHVAWEGFRFYDLIFPLFVFLVGVSIALAVPRSVAKKGRAQTVVHILTRGVLLYVIGLIYSGGLADGWGQIRWLGVLNRIALCYTVTALLFTFLSLRWLVPLAVAGLLGYWAILAWVPIRDIRMDTASLAKLAEQKGETNVVTLYQNTRDRIRGQYEPGYNVVNHLDFQYLPGRRYDTYWDPEGILSTLPAIVSCLLGLFAGSWLLNGRVAPELPSLWLVVAGFLLMSIGYLWGFQFPIIKKIWTSSYVLVAGGYSLILLGAFYHVVDIWGWRLWCQPFVWIGANALTIYLVARFINFGRLAERIAGGPIKLSLGRVGDLVVALLAVLLLFGFARFLYKRQIFLRL